MRKLWFLMLCLLFTGCGVTVTVGFMGATLSVQFPQRPMATAAVSVTTSPAATQGAKP